MKSRSRVTLGAAGAVLVMILAGCGSSSGGTANTRLEPGTATATPRAQVTQSPAAGAEVVAITLDGKTVSPRAERREITRDQQVVFQVNASEPGQLHIHSSPEQLVDFPAGESEITVQFDVPGVIDVEDHALGELIVQLEVS